MRDTDYKKKLLEGIYAEHYQTVYKYVLVSLDFNYPMTDDCMQDIFMLLLEKADKVVEHPNPGGFFIVTAKNYIKKYKTTMSKQAKKVTTLAEMPVLKYEEDFDQIFEHNADVEMLKKELLKRLNHNEMFIYGLFYEKGISISEISKTLHVSEGNVKVRLYRLRIKVKKMVRELFL